MHWASLARDKIAKELNLIDESKFAFCWIVDYPMFEKDEVTNKVKFSHNPFSMPQGDVKNLDFKNPLNIKAYQYDIVCNGIELSSGAIRNHIPELMYKLFSENSLKEIMKITSAEIGDSVFMACGKVNDIEKITSLARDKIGRELDLINENEFAFCWIVDYPMFEKDEITNKIKFSHNPFSMPQGNVKKIDFKNPLNIKAYQYDIVCNGVELSSGAIRNHIPELMYKLFSIVGHDKNQVNEKFSGMINALSYGAPPHEALLLV